MTGGYEHTVVVLFRWPSDLPIDALPRNTVTLGIDPTQYTRTAFVVRTLVRSLRKVEPDLIHSHHFYSDLYAVPAARIIGCPALRTVHGITQVDPSKPTSRRKTRDAWSPREKRIELALEDRTTRTIAVCHDLRRKLISYGIPPRKTTVVYPAVDLEEFARRASKRLRRARFRIGFVGRLEPVKNPLVIPEIADTTRRMGRSFEYTVVGDGRLRRRLLEEIRRRRLAHFNLERSSFNVPAKLRSLDALVVTSLSEGLPHIILEAMAVGVPVIASRVGGIPEVIEDGVNGHLCDPASAASFASRLRLCAENPEMTTAVVERAFQQVKLRFSIDIHLARLRRVYATVIRTKDRCQ